MSTRNLEPFGAARQIAYPSLLASLVWDVTLTLAVIFGSLALSCVAPLSALAVALAATLGLRASLATMALVWLVNQAIGFTLFHFPRTMNSFGWGLAIGIAALMITAAARWAVRSTASRSAPLRLGIALVVTFVVYEAVLRLAAVILGGSDMFTLRIVSEVAWVNAAWFVAMVGLNEIVAALCKPWLGRIPMMLRSPGST
jgi:hypothetical protein